MLCSSSCCLSHEQNTKQITKRQVTYELLYQERADLEMLKVFGSLCFADTLATNRSKLDPRARRCIFLGYKQGVKGYVVMVLTSHDVFLSGDVVFHEHILPYKGAGVISWNCLDLQSQGDTVDNAETPLVFRDEDKGASDSIEDQRDELIADNEVTVLPSVSPSDPTGLQRRELAGNTQVSDSTPHHPRSLDLSTDDTTTIIRRSTRPLKRPSYLENFQCNALPTRSSTAHSITHCYSHDKLSSAHSSYAFNISEDQEPTSFAEANKHSHWQHAMQTEIKALEENETWQLVDLPAGIKPIGNK